MPSPSRFVTIAMPCLNEAAFIETCLRSVQEQTYPRGLIEIVVADGGSTDGTREVLTRLAAEDVRISVLDNTERLQAAGLNRILQVAKGDVIVRMDVHCTYAPDYIERCVEVLERTGADGVGGAQRCRGRTAFEQAVCAALGSPLGMGGAAYRSADREGYVDTVFLGAYCRSVFERVGQWDPGAITNEDAELNQRLVLAGGRLYLSREIVVHYVPRSSFASLAKQYYRYGRGRARTLLKHHGLLSIRPVLPFLALASGLALLIALPWTNVLYALALVALAFVTEAIRVGSSGGTARVAIVTAIFPTLVFSHGVGFAAGLARSLVARARVAWLLALLTLVPANCSSGPPASQGTIGLVFSPLSGEASGLGVAMRQWRSGVEATHPPRSHRWWPWGLAAVDFDRDGDIDLLATQHGVGRTIVLRNKRGGGFRSLRGPGCARGGPQGDGDLA